MNHLKLVSDYFYKNGYINRSLLKKVFQDMLSEKQIRGLISKMENAGIIQKDGAGTYTRYVKTPDFPSFIQGTKIVRLCPKELILRPKDCNTLFIR